MTSGNSHLSIQRRTSDDLDAQKYRRGHLGVSAFCFSHNPFSVFLCIHNCFPLVLPSDFLIRNSVRISRVCTPFDVYSRISCGPKMLR